VSQDALFFELVGFLCVLAFVLFNERRRFLFIAWLILCAQIATDLRVSDGNDVYVLDSIHGVVAGLSVWVIWLLWANVLAWFNYPVRWSGYQ